MSNTQDKPADKHYCL